MIRKILLAAVLACGLTNTYASERPAEFARLTSSKLALTCAFQVIRMAGEIQREPIFEEPQKSKVINALLQVHVVWARLADPAEKDPGAITKAILAQSPDARVAADNYCTKEGSAMLTALSMESRNRITSKALDLQTQIAQ